MWKGFFAGRRPLLIAPFPRAGRFPNSPPTIARRSRPGGTLPGAKSVEQDHFVPSNDPSTFVFTKADELRQLFRIPLTGR